MPGGLPAHLLQREPVPGGQPQREGSPARGADPVGAAGRLREARPAAALVVQQGKPPACLSVVWRQHGVSQHSVVFGSLASPETDPESSLHSEERSSAFILPFLIKSFCNNV